MPWARRALVYVFPKWGLDLGRFCLLLSVSYWFSQGRHSIVLSQEDAESRGRSIRGPLCWTDLSLALTLSYNQHFPEINKSLQGSMNLRLRRETLIKQLNCQSEVTLKVSLFERKHNGAIFMLTTQSHAWPASGSHRCLSKNGSHCTVIRESPRLTTLASPKGLSNVLPNQLKPECKSGFLIATPWCHRHFNEVRKFSFSIIITCNSRKHT